MVERDSVSAGEFFMKAVLIVLAIAAIAGGLVFWWLWEKKRAEAWQALAKTLGMTFHGKGGSFDEPGFGIFESGYKKRAKNYVSGEMRGAKVRIADYTYQTRSVRSSNRSSSKSHTQTVFMIDSPALSIPQFSLKREFAALNFLGNMLGGQDIDFSEDEAFSKAFILRGENESATRAAFQAPVREVLMRHKGSELELEGAESVLVAHWDARRKPEEVLKVLDDLFDLVDAFANATNAEA
ncbi:MAG: hypothetical protein ACI9MR_004984 [Myxococcota bacterium]|jgi:hypothetical protein